MKINNKTTVVQKIVSATQNAMTDIVCAATGFVTGEIYIPVYETRQCVRYNELKAPFWAVDYTTWLRARGQ